MRNIHEVELFGMEIEIKEFSAVEGMHLLSTLAAPNPKQLLSGCRIKIGDDFVLLKNAALINEHVFDRAQIISPFQSLLGICKLVEDANFAFISKWNPVAVPHRFVSGARSVSPQATPSVINQLIQEGAATKKELEEYYSVLDAFQMLDILTAKGVNAAYAHEAAERERNK